MTSPIEALEAKSSAAKTASRRLAYLSTEVKNRALCNISEDLLAKKEAVLQANRIDYQSGESRGMDAAMLDRLMLSAERLEAIAQDVLAVAALPDPVFPALSHAGDKCEGG